MSVAVCALAELAEDSNRAFTVNGQSVLVCRSSAGVFAVENRCSHQLAPLEGGKVKGFHLFCPKHGARFDLRTGVANQLAKTPIRVYAVDVVDEQIMIRNPGDAA